MNDDERGEQIGIVTTIKIILALLSAGYGIAASMAFAGGYHEHSTYFVLCSIQCVLWIIATK